MDYVTVASLFYCGALVVFGVAQACNRIAERGWVAYKWRASECLRGEVKNTGKPMKRGTATHMQQPCGSESVAVCTELVGKRATHACGTEVIAMCAIVGKRVLSRC